jgi:glycerol-3-phosphate dehydrogenase subunit B
MLSRGLARVKALPRAFRAAYLGAMLDADVLVIGGGVAGTAAALAAADGGARVALVRRGPGASALAAGAWIGEPPAAFRTALAAAGLDLERTPAPLPLADGRVLPFDMAPPSHAAAALPDDDGAVLVCGIAGLPGFRPHALVRLWHATRPRGLTLRSASLLLPATPAAGWAAASLAARIEHDPMLLFEPVQRALDEHDCSRAVLPAVLGLHGHPHAWETLRSAGLRVSEAVGGTPSIPGWRLDGALLTALRQAGIQVVAGRARGYRRGGGGEHTVVIEETGGQSVTMSATALVLATGSFVGGGIKAKPALTETVMGLPVHATAAGRHFRDPGDALALTVHERTGRQPLLAAGVMEADADEAGVFIAGAVRSDSGAMAGTGGRSDVGVPIDAGGRGDAGSRSGLGHAAADGWRAGLAAAEGS